MSEVPGDGTAHVADRHLCCTMTAVILNLVRSDGGQPAVRELLIEAGSRRTEDFLPNPENWISLDEAMELLAAGAKAASDPGFARRVGENMLLQHAGTQVATLLRSLGSPEAILKAIAASAAKLSTVTDMTCVEGGPGHAVVRAVAREGFIRRARHCDWATGVISSVTTLFGEPRARVVETECQARGGSQCLYEVFWDAEGAAAAADPEQRVTVLEAQLRGMSDRLQSAYATAGELTSVAAHGYTREQRQFMDGIAIRPEEAACLAQFAERPAAAVRRSFDRGPPAEPLDRRDGSVRIRGRADRGPRGIAGHDARWP